LRLKPFARFIEISLRKGLFLKNIFRTAYKKNALLSYIVLPFTGIYRYLPEKHTNLCEARSWARALKSLGYNVDVVDYESSRHLKLGKYDLICGFGDVFQQRFESWQLHDIKTIYYGTGMHVCHQNHASLSRVKDVYFKTGSWLAESARFVEKTWSHQTTLVDGMVVLGNQVLVESYRRFYDGPIHLIPALFLNAQDAECIWRERGENHKKACRSFLWFGSSGLIHKGLDLLLEAFDQRRDLNLHICGPLSEKGFLNAYSRHLYESENIFVHGFVDVRSRQFSDILGECDFVIFPSCSEGGASSVLTAIGNGALIPIVSRESTISVPHQIDIENLDLESVCRAIDCALAMDSREILDCQWTNFKYVTTNHSLEIYLEKLTAALNEIISIKPRENTF
jgi:hypothetical protein